MPIIETKETHDSKPFYIEYNWKKTKNKKTSSFQDRVVFSFKYSKVLKNKLDLLSLMKTEMRNRLVPIPSHIIKISKGKSIDLVLE